MSSSGRWVIGFMGALLVGAAAVAADVESPPSIQVLIVGTYHFDNPGLDIHNVEADDVLTPQRQREIEAVTEALAQFRPNRVAVEWPAAAADKEYAAYRKGELEATRNEVVQLGFRLAARQKLARVHGIDALGEFPFEAVQAWAETHGKSDALGALMQKAGAITAEATERQKTHSIGAMLRHMNRPDEIAKGQGFYMETLRYGDGDEQPGAELNAAWARRNFLICARLMQQLEAGDRAVVFYGAGHAHALQRCAIETPGVTLVDAADYLPE